MRVCQFVHHSRPSIDYSAMTEIERVELPDRPEPNGYLNAILRAWRAQEAGYGMVVLEQDIAIDRRHLNELLHFTTIAPRVIWAVPYLVWPISTGRAEPLWAHSRAGSVGSRILTVAAECCPFRIDYFALGCTYLPARLLGLMPDTDREWDYPILDERISDCARRHDIHAYTTVLPAIHLHW